MKENLPVPYNGDSDSEEEPYIVSQEPEKEQPVENQTEKMRIELVRIRQVKYYNDLVLSIEANHSGEK